MSDKHRANLVINNFPTPGHATKIETRPLEKNQAEAIAAEARSLGHQGTVTKA